jgi:hypothetical protein
MPSALMGLGSGDCGLCYGETTPTLNASTAWFFKAISDLYGSLRPISLS